MKRKKPQILKLKADSKRSINTIIIPKTRPIVKSLISTEITLFKRMGRGSTSKIYTLKW